MTDTNTRWRKKPVVIDAVHILALGNHSATFNDTPDWLGAALDVRDFASTLPVEVGRVMILKDHIAIGTLEGVMKADVDDWLIRGVKGEIYPCKPDIFEATYEPANEGEPTMPRGDDFHDEFSERYFGFNVRKDALAFAVGNASASGGASDPKRIVDAAQTFADFLDGAANDPVMAELKPTLKMQDGTEPPPHVARMIAEYLELDERRKKLGTFILENPIFDGLPDNEREAMADQHVAMEEYYSALMRRLAYAGAMTS